MKDFYGQDMTVQTLPINLMLINASERGREVRFGADSNFKEACVREVVAVALHSREVTVFEQSTHQAHVVKNLILQELMATFVYITAFKK